MIAKTWSDWKRYIVNCKEEQLFDKLKQIANKWGKILGWNVCPTLQALMHNEHEVDIWVEVIDNQRIAVNAKLEYLYKKQ